MNSARLSLLVAAGLLISFMLDSAQADAPVCHTHSSDPDCTNTGTASRVHIKSLGPYSAVFRRVV